MEPQIVEQRLRRACQEMERRVRAGETHIAEEVLHSFPELAADEESALELVYTEFTLCEEVGANPRPDEFLGRFPHLKDRLGRLFDIHRVFDEHPTQLVSDPRASTITDPAEYRAPDRSAARTDADGLERYELVEVLGRGGMGVVYKARQADLQRLVALKLLPQSADGNAARFLNEATAVAKLDHPNIVKIHDMGYRDGTPYLALEYVDGGTLEDRLAELTLSERDACELMESLALAMDYAHQHGIIHRDLKPGNIMLTRDGVPKISDFGLAKLVATEDAETPRLTRTGALLGTPCYMAPEQASGQPIDRRTDVYGLGVLLYEIFTGRPPFLRETALDTLEEIRTRDPLPPRQLNPAVPRDVETICLKCLEKEPASRYRTAKDLALELRRHLNSEPIVARPVNILARAWRWCRRKPALAALWATIAALLLLLAGGGYWTAWQQNSLRMAAEQEREKSAAVAHYMVNILRSPDPALDGQSITVAATLADAMARLETEMDDDPQTKSAVYHALGQTYYGLGLYDESLVACQKAYDLRRQHLGGDHIDTLLSASILGDALRETGDRESALQYHFTAHRQLQRLLGDNHEYTLMALMSVGQTVFARGEPQQAIELLHQAHRRLVETRGALYPLSVQCLQELALAHNGAGHYETAAELLEGSLDAATQEFGPDDLRTLHLEQRYAQILKNNNRPVQARGMLEKVWAEYRQLLGENHPRTLTAGNNLATVYCQLGDYDLAAPILEQIYKVRRTHLGTEHPHTLTSMHNWAWILEELGDFPQALQTLEQTFELRRRVLGVSHPDTLQTAVVLGSLLTRAQQPARAIEVLLEARKLIAEHFGDRHGLWLECRHHLAGAYLAEQRVDDAIREYQETLAVLRNEMGIDHPCTLICMNNLGRAYRAADRPRKAVAMLEEILASTTDSQSPTHPDALNLRHNLCIAYREIGELDSARTHIEACLAGWLERDPEHWNRYRAECELGLIELAGDQLQTGRRRLESGLAALKERRDTASPLRQQAIGEIQDAAEKILVERGEPDLATHRSD